jgi:hypothetical protein
MSGIRSITRRPTVAGYASGASAPIYVDSDDNLLKYIPAGSGTTEVVVQTNIKAGVTPTAAVALTAAQSGFNVWLNAAAGFAITLPAPAAGLNYRFTTAAAFATTNFTVVTASGADILFGSADVNSTLVGCAAQDTINFVSTAETKGDFVEVWSDGTGWFVNGVAAAAGGITFTAT